MEVFASDDADDTTVEKIALTAFSRYDDADHYLGLAVEQARFQPLGDRGWTDHRAYLRFADTHDDYKWSGRVGTDGSTVLGSIALVRDRAWRQEYFAERELLETRSGRDGRYITFAGAAFDVPLGSSGQQLTVLAGLQDFPGDNLRTHLRAVYSLPLVEEWGLGMQVRARTFHNSEPREMDYFSPRRFDEVLPQLRLRRFHGGWMFSVSGGVGRQRDSDSDWRAARLAEVIVESPRWSNDWYLRTHLLYSNTPVGDGSNYGYRQVHLQLVRGF
ncbi:hypothetical protein ACW7G2_09980 [Luteimonas sp. A277]